MKKPRMLTTLEIATRYDVSYSTVIAWIRRGKLKAVKQSAPRGDIWLVPETALKTFDQERRKKGRPKKKAATVLKNIN
jgi:excisionase family DNA binding protein